MPMNERKYVAVSVKHSTNNKWYYWGSRTKDEERRSFSGYTVQIDACELYSLEDWAESVYVCAPWMKIDEAVEPTQRLKQKYRKYDTVLMDINVLRKFSWLK